MKAPKWVASGEACFEVVLFHLYSCVVWEYYFVIIGFPNTVKEKSLEIQHSFLIVKLVCYWVLLPGEGGKTNPLF